MDSKRIKKLRTEIIKTIPRFPNNKATKEILESKHLTDLLFVYLNWATRLIVARPRIVELEREVTGDARWSSISSQFEKLKDKIENGEDLIPHLSLKAQEKGFTPNDSESDQDTDKWADKDFLLNVMGFYHFHLGDIQETGKKIAERTDNVVFARVSRDTFRAIGIFNHEVFESVDPASREMTAERERLWQLFDQLVTNDAPHGSIVVPSMITTSGHTLDVVRRASDYTRIIKDIDPKLDDREFVNSLYEDTDIEPPNKPKIEWCLRGTDLGVFDRSTNLFAVLRYGAN